MKTKKNTDWRKTQYPVEETRSVEEVVSTLNTLSDIVRYTETQPISKKRLDIMRLALNKMGAIYEWEGIDEPICPFVYPIARCGDLELIWDYEWDYGWVYNWLEKKNIWVK